MKIFISRKLEPASIFRKKLANYALQIADQSLVEFNSKQFELPSSYDWLFFYSKTGVQNFFKQINSFLGTTKIAALGPGTAEAIEKIFGIIPDFIGNGEPEQTAQSFKEFASGQKVVFVRASDSRKSIQKLLVDSVIVDDVIAYENKSKDIIERIEADILIFTSPLNAKAYFGQYVLAAHQKIIAIGNTTADAIKLLGARDVLISESPSENALADLVLQILEDKNK